MNSFTDEYIEVLKTLAESDAPMIAPYPMHFTPEQSRFVKELMDAGKATGKLEYDNPNDLKITGVRINLNGRLLLDHLETEKYKRTVMGRLKSDNTVAVLFGVFTGIITNVFAQWIIKLLKIGA